MSEVAGSGPAADIPQEIDECELVDPVDKLTPLEKTGFWAEVKATKWSERKEAVAELSKLVLTKRIAPGDFTEICLTLKKATYDENPEESDKAEEEVAIDIAAHGLNWLVGRSGITRKKIKICQKMSLKVLQN